MPRSIQDILDHADELAKRYEDFDPDHANEIPVEEYVLQRAVVARARSEQQLVDTVISARGAGNSVRATRCSSAWASSTSPSPAATS